MVRAFHKILPAVFDVLLLTRGSKSHFCQMHHFRRVSDGYRGWNAVQFVLFLTYDVGTLQEPIAPASVDFFSVEGVRIGNKTELESKISAITGIPVVALRGASLSGFSVEERKSWAAHRKTKRIEDSAYCLMGIFDVYMPLMYGERENALTRLEKKIKKSTTVSDRLALTSTAGRSEFLIGDYSDAIEADQNLESTNRWMADAQHLDVAEAIRPTGQKTSRVRTPTSGRTLTSYHPYARHTPNIIQNNAVDAFGFTAPGPVALVSKPSQASRNPYTQRTPIIPQDPLAVDHNPNLQRTGGIKMDQTRGRSPSSGRQSQSRRRSPQNTEISESSHIWRRSVAASGAHEW